MHLALALARSHLDLPPAGTYSPLYYATIATVIPVLLVAVALQRDQYEDLFTRLARYTQSRTQRDADEVQDGPVPSMARALLESVKLNLAFAIAILAFTNVVLAILAELLALLCLGIQYGDIYTFGITLVAVEGLVYAAAIRPGYLLIQVLRPMLARPRSSHVSAEQPPAAEQEPGDTQPPQEPAETPGPETASAEPAGEPAPG